MLLAASLLGAAGIQYAINGFSTLACLWQFPLLTAGMLVGLVLLFLLVLFVSTLFVDPKKMVEKPSAYFRFMLNQFCRLALFLGGVRVHVTGLEQVPRKSRFMLADLAFLAKKESFSIFVVAQIMREVLCLPLDRENDREALKAILKAIQFLKEDKCSIVVFPEGGTNRTEEDLLPFRNGAFKVAQKANVPIVICALVNSKAILKNMFRRHTDVYLDVLAVIPPEELEGLKTIDIGDRAHGILLEGLRKRKAALAAQ